MVGVAGLAVLGMTASLADAQTAHQAAFTLNDVMQSPFASDMLAAPTGTAVAWVFNAKGCSNIWVADPPWREGASDHTVHRGRRFRYRQTRLVAGYEVDRLHTGPES